MVTLGYDGDALVGMDGTDVRVIKGADEVGISGLLQRGDSRALDNAVSCIKVVLELMSVEKVNLGTIRNTMALELMCYRLFVGSN